MKIIWWRILVVAVVLELLYGGFLYQVIGDTQQAFAPVGLISVFIFMLLGGALIGWMAPSRKLLQATLVGVTAVVFYTLLTIPVVVSGELQITGPLLLNHLLKIIGAAAGGLLASSMGQKIAGAAGS